MNYFLIIFLLFSLNIYSQCKVDRFEDKDAIMMATDREIIEDLIRYENGFLASAVLFVKGVSKLENVKPRYGLYVSVGVFMTVKAVKPTEIILSTNNTKNISLKASSIEPLEPPSGKGIYFESFFGLSEEELNFIRNEEIINILVVDENTDLKISLSPEKNLFKNQLNCLIQDTE